jgi:hypothetical protein
VIGPVKHTVRGGEVCCCGGMHCSAWNDGHDVVHVCDYYKVPCDCVLEDREEWRPRIYPDKATLDLWLASLRWDGEPCFATVRACIEVAKHVKGERDRALHSVIASVEAWLRCPCVTHLGPIRDLHSPLAALSYGLRCLCSHTIAVHLKARGIPLRSRTRVSVDVNAVMAWSRPAFGSEAAQLEAIKAHLRTWALS